MAFPTPGFLYAGVMIDGAGHPRTLEFNCRFGDPETQPIMARLKSDLVDLLEHAVNGTLDTVDAEWDRRTALGVVLAAAGYPDSPRKGDVIDGLQRITPEAHRPDVVVFHAGTALADGAHGGQRRSRAVRDRAGGLRAPGAARRLCSDRRHRISPACSFAPTSATARSPPASNVVDSAATRAYLLDLQARIVAGLEAIGGEPFRSDAWARPEGGGGLSRLIENGSVLERGGVLFSHVRGEQLPASATAHRPELAGRSWEAMGVSLVLHPRNPYAPTVHLNVRLFASRKDGAEPVWWFGGGMDLTPYYGYRRGRDPFPSHLPRCAERRSATDVHARYKKWCDDYFYLKHRKEPRGVGGIFLRRPERGRLRALFRADAKRR